MGTHHRSVLIAVVVAFALLLPAAAFAQTKLERARKHFEQAEAYFKAKTYDKAVEEYQAAYDLVPKAGLLFNIGLSHENGGQLESAVSFYQQYIAEAPDGPKAPEARARMEALARDLLEKQRAEELARTNETGEKDPVEKDPVEKDPVDTPPLDGPIGDRPVDPVDDRTRPSLLPGAIAFGAAAVLAGVGVGFGVRSNSTLGEIDDELDSGTPPLDSGDPRFDDGKRDALIADVSFALAGAAAVTGAILTLRALMSDSRPSSVSVNPTVGVGQAGVGVQVIW